LARGGCLAAYRWDSGSDWNGKAWNQERFPTDAEVSYIYIYLYKYEKIVIIFDLILIIFII